MKVEVIIVPTKMPGRPEPKPYLAHMIVTNSTLRMARDPAAWLSKAVAKKVKALAATMQEGGDLE